MNSKTILNEIELAIVWGLKPHFLAIAQEEEFIHVIVSHPSFNIKSVSSRVRIVFNILREYNPAILKQSSIIVETFNTDEMHELLESVL